ncbi:MAG: DNA polymerase III subunit epsilon [Deltaproteobacteria bacterium HGW-Deltaproteobacteria-9]|nr:MAG: DNA polymerase III subunit epsilon [Deltaproteobacteria bacterium HGW-Deltaproteobacteria-9]
MNPGNKYRWSIVASIATFCILIIMITFSFRQQAPFDHKALLISLFMITLLLLAGLGFAIGILFHHYIRPMRKLAEETILITSVNPSHRIDIKGGKEVLHLVQIINEKADRFEELQKDVWYKIQLAMAQAEEEKNILAAIVSELPEGILICNAEGQILLYNKQAKHYLEGDDEKASYGSGSESYLARAGAGNRFVGLGRSVFVVIDKNLIVHALDEIAYKLERKEANVTVHVIAVGGGNRLLRAEAVPILNHLGQLTGFVLIFQDIIKQIETDNRVSFLMQSLTRGVRTSVASIRTAIDAILELPEMDPLQREGFKKIIRKEALASGAILDETALDYSCHIKARRPLVQMLGKDLLETIKRQAEDSLGINIKIVYSKDQGWIKVDCYSLLLAVLFVLNHLRDETRTDTFTCKLEREGKYANLDLIWQGKPLRIQTLREWEAEVVVVGKEGIPSTLREVIEHHGAKMWPATLRQAAGDDVGIRPRSHENSIVKSGLRLFLPDVESPEPDSLRRITVLPQSRPEFYDFDLFNQPGLTPELDNRPLSDLTYTIFDTETTGLFPKVGDEIISIGAVRIVNGRLLREELFDQLVNPQRGYWQPSIEIHGIHPEMLEGQPTIDKVLPLFHRFAEDSILVAHNAAFDMNMLQMKEALTGVKFINPVLDTLLLSAVVHPAQDNHTLEAIAGRLGVSIVGRHTALGDALATAEIFLKLIPLLAKMGIRTFGEARLASQKTHYARFKY